MTNILPGTGYTDGAGGGFYHSRFQRCPFIRCRFRGRKQRGWIFASENDIPGRLETDECAMHSFHGGTIKDICTTAVYSGCGKINASITAQLLIDRYDVDAIIFSGIAGGMKKEIQVFDTIVCTASAFHDTDNEIYTDFPVMKEPIFYADDGLTALAKEAAGRIGRKIHFGVATTGDRYMEPIHPDALCIDMETAAVAHACYLNGVPFIAVRSISDNDKEAGQEAINRNYDKAVQQSYQFILEMLEGIR